MNPRFFILLMFVLLALLLPALMAHTNKRSELAADVTGSIWLIKWLDVIGYLEGTESLLIIGAVI